ncbi:MAG TPA: winged helix DNA-binding domain-containing protein [Micromonosporaceae bacterium]|jgi:hypothetical protein
MRVSPTDALAMRMISLLLAPRPSSYGSEPVPSDVAGVVTWLGAMQAQDNASAAWSFGMRLPGLTAAGLDAAIERREAVRTWPMRGTVHYVPPRDAHWMLDLMGARVLAGAAKRRAYLGLSQEVADRSVDVFGEALAGGKRLTRAQCLDALRDNGIDVGSHLGYHLLWYASQRGVTCFAPNVGNEQAFMLLDEFVPDPHRLDPEEALATIALRYFRGHGPTTAADFAGWTGLPITACRRGIAATGDALAQVDVDGVPMVADRALVESFPFGARASRRASALPGFDEYLLGYKDRSLMLDEQHTQAVIPGGNGVFQPTVVLAGRVVGTWRRATKRARVEVTVTPFGTLRTRDRTAVEAAFRPYGGFVGLPCTVTWA